MDIRIEAPSHSNQPQLTDYYTQLLNKKYASYPFVKVIEVKVATKPGGLVNVSLMCKPEKGKMLFASDSNKNENKALTEAIRKMNTQIEKYKAVHYH